MITLTKIEALREKAEASLHHWLRIREDATQVGHWHDAPMQITWLRGYLRAMDDLNQGEACSWQENEAHAYWEGGCGLPWEFTTGTPESNGFKFCPRCGKPVKLL
jgi:hypothetical protein